MPLTTPISYPPTLQEFISHWQQVNASRLGPPPTPIVLQDSYGVTELIADRDRLVTLMDLYAQKVSVRDVAASQCHMLKGPLRERASQFRLGVLSQLRRSAFASQVEPVPRLDSPPPRFLGSLQNIKNLWSQINAATVSGFTPPLLLAGGYTLAQFTTDVTAFSDAVEAVQAAGSEADVAIAERDELLPVLRARLIDYRRAVQANYAKTDAFVQSLPAVSPTRGSTPDAVALTGIWNATQEVIELTWTTSANPDLARYSVRTSQGTSYQSNAEIVLADVLPPATTFQSERGSSLPSGAFWVKVYVVTDSGHERGSNAVKITRA